MMGGVAILVEALNPDNTVLVPKFWVIFGFIGVLTLIAYFGSLLGLKKGGQTSVLVTMGSLVLKMLFSMSFALVYLLKFKVNSVHFGLEFFSIYFFFTAFEVYALLCNLRHQNKT